MALLLLGTNTIAIEDEWVQFDPVPIQSNRTYLLELETLSSNPDQIYSRFQVRYTYPTQNSGVSASLNVSEFFYAPIRQNVVVPISGLLAPTGTLVFYVRRFAYFSKPSNLAEVRVRLGIDPAIFSSP